MLSSDPKRIKSLDGLRGISIWAVMLAHISAHFQTPLSGHYLHSVLSNLSYLGVTVFFVISGFLITSLLIKEYLRFGPVDLARFYKRRAARILPASVVYIGTVIAFGKPTFVQDVYALTYTTSFFFREAYKPLQQLWSLSVEEQFYLLWPLVFLFGVHNAKKLGWTVLFFSPIIRIELRRLGYPEIQHLAPAIGDSLVAGCLLALYQDAVFKMASRFLVRTPAFVALCVVTVSVSFMVFRWNLVLLWGIVPCMIALAIGAAILREDRLLNVGPLVWSGLLSYSLYLWQQPFLVMNGPLNFLSARLTATLAAALLSYYLIERPALRFFNHVSRPAATEDPARQGNFPDQSAALSLAKGGVRAEGRL